MTSLKPARDPAPDDDAFERMLRGVVGPDDAPPEHRYAAQLLRAARSAPGPTELALEKEMVAGAVALLAPQRPQDRRLSLRVPHTAGRRLAAALAAAGAAGLVSGSLALAGALPDGVQRPLAHALSRVGITIPAPATTHSSVTPSRTVDDRGARSAGACRAQHCAHHGVHSGHTPAVGLEQPSSPSLPTPRALGAADPAPAGSHPELPNLPSPPAATPLPPPISAPQTPPVLRQSDPVQSPLSAPPPAGPGVPQPDLPAR